MKSIDREGEKRERQHATHGHDQLFGDRKTSLPDENAGRRKVCAPETIDGRTAVHETEQALHDDTAKDSIEKEESPHHPPPNQFFSNLQRDEPDVVNDSFQLSAPSSKIKKKNRDKPKSKPKKDDERDLATRAKYPTLDTFLTASPVANETSSKGVFGEGDSPPFRQNEATATEDEDFIDKASPSILSRNKTARNRVANKGDWFQCHEENAGVEDRKRKKTTPGTRKRNQTTKQGKNVSFKGKMPAPKRFSGQDDDLQRAIKLSKEEAERHPMLEFSEQDDDLLQAIEMSKERLKGCQELRHSLTTNSICWQLNARRPSK